MTDHANELRRYAPLLGRPTMMLAAADEIERLAAKLEAAEKDVAIKEEVIDSLAAVVKRLDAQCDAAEKAVTEAHQRGYAAGQEEIEKERYTLRDALEQVFGSGLLSGSYTLHERMRNIVSNALSEQQEINLSDPAVQKRLAAQWGYVPAGAQPAPSVPREAIEKMLTQLMDIAVSNGANSISMPDEYVEVAAWLCGIPAQPAPSVPEGFSREDLEAVADGLDGYEKTVNVGNVTGEGDDHLESTTAYAARFIRAMLAAAPEAKP